MGIRSRGRRQCKRNRRQCKRGVRCAAPRQAAAASSAGGIPHPPPHSALCAAVGRRLAAPHVRRAHGPCNKTSGRPLIRPHLPNLHGQGRRRGPRLPPPPPPAARQDVPPQPGYGQLHCALSVSLWAIVLPCTALWAVRFSLNHGGSAPPPPSPAATPFPRRRPRMRRPRPPLSRRPAAYDHIVQPSPLPAPACGVFGAGQGAPRWAVRDGRACPYPRLRAGFLDA